jgi:hypothetical protein
MAGPGLTILEAAFASALPFPLQISRKAAILGEQ